MMAIHAVHFYGFMKSNLSPAVVSCKKKGLGLFISYISQRERRFKNLSGRTPNYSPIKSTNFSRIIGPVFSVLKIETNK